MGDFHPQTPWPGPRPHEPLHCKIPCTPMLLTTHAHTVVWLRVEHWAYTIEATSRCKFAR